MISAGAFRAIVAQTNDDVAKLKRLPLDGWEPLDGFPPYTTRSSYDAVAAAFNLDVRGPRSDEDIREHLYGLTDRALAGDPDAEWRELKALERQIIFDACLDGAEFRWPLNILQLLLERSRHRKSSARGPWLGWEIACQRARDVHELLHSGIQDEESLRLGHRREFMVGAAAVRLRGAGLAVRARDGAVLDEELVDQASRRVDRFVAAAGGLSVLRNVFASIGPTFDPVMGRHHLVRRPTASGEGVTPALPVGYIVRLAVKHVAQAPNSTNSTDDSFSAATDLATVYDLQPYSFFETMFRQGDSLIALLRELALYDSTFALVQLRPTDIVPLLQGLLSFATNSYGRGWRIQDATRVVQAILHDRGPGPSLVSPSEIAARSGCTPTITDAVLADLTHDRAPYENVLAPSDLAEPEFLLRPLISLPDGRLLLVDPAHCGWSFYEALLAQIRSQSRRADSDVGGAFEAFVHQQLASRGVVCRRGEYTSTLGAGEVDAAIETEQHIIFIEMKKKVLRRVARTGSDAHILIDLEGSLLDSANQATGHELALRTDGVLHLTQRGGPSYDLRFDGRQIEHVSLSLLDYGSFQDRTIIQQILTLPLMATVAPRDQSLNEAFDRLNRALLLFRRQQEQVVRFDARRAQHPFFNRWFLSLGHLLVLLDSVTSNASFQEALWATRHLTTKSLDFYFELRAARDIRRRRAAGSGT